MSYHGKKIGTLEVKLDRKKDRYRHASVTVELRLDLSHGTFWAQYDGSWYSDATKDGLEAKIKVAATKALSIDWKRYIQIDYTAEGFPIEDPKSGRPARQGRYKSFDLDADRSKFEDDKREPYAICSVSLNWSICEISEPYSLPEDPKKTVRAMRDVNVWRWGEDTGKEKIGDPQEWEDDVLPRGTFLWTPEREALLAEIVGALGKLDQRFVALFSGDAEQLAKKIDAAAQTDPSRLLAAPAEGQNAKSKPSKKRRHA